MLSTLKLPSLVIPILVLASPNVQSQTAPPLTQSIEVSINGSRLNGTAEIGPLLAGKATAEQRRIFDQAVKSVRRNEAFQLVVVAVASDGTRVDLTGSVRLRYVDDGCLTVSTAGFVSVVATDRCVGANRPSLVVSLLSSDLSSVVGLNEYFFSVTD
ncbi:MAG: hypothetical protein AMXMBFR59_42680 [Rhodanobacteraceae bacterium]